VGIKLNHTHIDRSCRLFQPHHINADSPSAVIKINDKVARVVSVIGVTIKLWGCKLAPQGHYLRQYTLYSHLNREFTAFTYDPLILETAIQMLFVDVVRAHI